MKIFAGTFTVVFLLFAAVQYNDDDIAIWLPAYLYAALTSFLMTRKMIIPVLILIGVIGYFCAAVYLFTPDVFGNWVTEEMTQQSSKMKSPLMKEGRDFWGLVICFVVHTIYLFRAVSKNKLSIG